MRQIEFLFLSRRFTDNLLSYKEVSTFTENTFINLFSLINTEFKRNYWFAKEVNVYQSKESS